MLDRDSLRQILIPSWSQMLVCVVATLALVIAAGSARFHGFLTGTGLLNNTYIQQVVATNLSSVSHVSLVNIAVIILFWSGVYLAVYTVFWLLSNMIVEARNELVIETEFANKDTLRQRLRAPLLQVVLAVILIVLLILSSLFGFPNWIGLMQNALLNVTAPVSMLYGLFGFGASIINIFALWSLTQVVFAVD